MKQLIFANALFSNGKEYRNCLITIEKGIIEAVEFVSVEDNRISQSLQVENLAPGFIDIHINGGDELHFTCTPTVEAIRNMVQSSRETGVAFVLPTCITSPWETIKQAVDAMKHYSDSDQNRGVLGMHLEGPFISVEKRGAHLTEYIQRISDEAVDELIALSDGVIKLLTVAPEFLSDGQVKRLQNAGIRLAAGHSNASFDEAMDGFDNGITMCTHLYNAMSSFGHREPGLVGAVFSNQNVYAPIIIDGVHCHLSAARIAYEQKGNRLILISDALFLGRKKERFEWGAFDATLKGDRYVNTEGNLAGGALSLTEVFVKAVNEVKIPLAEAVAMVTSRPVKALQVSEKVGTIEVGYQAVFTTFDYNLSHFEVIDFTQEI